MGIFLLEEDNPIVNGCGAANKQIVIKGNQLMHHIGFDSLDFDESFAIDM